MTLCISAVLVKTVHTAIPTLSNARAAALRHIVEAMMLTSRDTHDAKMIGTVIPDLDA